jgi:predicted small secreted protein
MRRSAVAVLLVAALALGACNTVKGAGRDIQSVGQAGQDAINSVKN